jgi:hypothetical protein
MVNLSEQPPGSIRRFSVEQVATTILELLREHESGAAYTRRLRKDVAARIPGTTYANGRLMDPAFSTAFSRAIRKLIERDELFDTRSRPDWNGKRSVDMCILVSHSPRRGRGRGRDLSVALQSSTPSTRQHLGEGDRAVWLRGND